MSGEMFKMNLDEMANDELRVFAKSNGIYIHHAVKNRETLIATIRNGLDVDAETVAPADTGTDADDDADADDVTAPAPAPAPAPEMSSETAVIGKIEGLGIQAKFEDGIFYFRHNSGKQDSGTMAQPLETILRCAREVARG
jgi:hypothetical protein